MFTSQCINLQLHAKRMQRRVHYPREGQGDRGQGVWQLCLCIDCAPQISRTQSKHRPPPVPPLPAKICIGRQQSRTTNFVANSIFKFYRYVSACCMCEGEGRGGEWQEVAGGGPLVSLAQPGRDCMAGSSAPPACLPLQCTRTRCAALRCPAPPPRTGGTSAALSI